MANVVRLALCSNRHEVPGNPRAIYPAVVDFSDLREIDLLADLWACRIKMDEAELELYVTGVQYPLVAVINACLRRGVRCTIYHHSPDGSWYKQPIYTGEEKC